MTGETIRTAQLGPTSAPWLFGSTLQAILETFNGDGAVTRVVGGAVRNALLDTPVSDIDLATTLLPEQVAERGRAQGYAVIETGIEHGTVTIVAGRHGSRLSVEVTTLRADVATDGRRATVAFSDDWEGDAARRDFTVNALYCDADGTLHDPVGGMDDIAVRAIRFVGDPAARIAEDYLRILRFFRFTAQYSDGDADLEGLKASIEGQEGIARLSAERIRQELLKLLPAPGAIAMLETMAEAGILQRICGSRCSFKTVAALAGIEQEQSLEPDVLLRLAALMLHDGVTSEDIQDQLRLSRAETKVLGVLESAPLIDALSLADRDHKAMLYHLGAESFVRAVLLAWARSGAAANDAQWAELLALPARWQAPVFPLAGKDVIEAGIPPGPAVGRILGDIERRWIDGGFAYDRAALLERVRNYST